MLGCLASLMLTMAAGKRVDHAWKLVRRAAGHRQERGALERIFATSVGRRRGRSFAVLVPHHPGPGADARPAATERVGFRDYYRQFDDLDERELNRERRARREAREAHGARAAARPRPVGHRVARPAALRGRERGDRARPRARQPLPGPLRRAGAARCWPSATGSSPSRSCSATARPSCSSPRRWRCSAAATSSSCPGPPTRSTRCWPRTRGARPVFAEHGRLSDAVTGRTRACVVVCNPNDPTGDYLPLDRAAARCSPGCPPTCTCCSTRRSSTSRTRRTWTPACASWTRSRGCWSCAPSRRSTGCPACAPATPSAPDADLLAAVAPVLGVNALTQAAVEHALRTGDAEIDRRRRAVSRERAAPHRGAARRWTRT